MSITITLEEKLVILISIYDLGGCGTKEEVLDNIDEKCYLNLTQSEKQYKENRHELVWRNTLAFERKHLVQAGYLDGSIRNQWKITSDGIDYMVELCNLFSQSSPSLFKKSTSNLLVRALNIKDEFSNDYSDREKEFQEDLIDLENEIEQVSINRIKRYQKITRDLKSKYGNQCQIEGCNFTFVQKNQKHYSEAHHLNPLANNGSQDEENVVILCPNHHRMMHYAIVEVSERKGFKRKLLISNVENYIVYK
ncbi:winged helix-turn-helix domain-containing protein [Sedimentibacter sp. B4]|uniref:winged helix-turn-helix domain-containing protein n=1 Tax=Sedimentibacter sp. B4 TaxID=304766 RepID=UPI0003019C36|nr:winged helix-turn-helix domain-containing protein [Sedimentibacter sp. B4]